MNFMAKKLSTYRMKGGFYLLFKVEKMPILRGLRALKIDDCRKHRKNQGKPQKHPRRIGICWTLNKNNILFLIF